jgi:hypothetical protein
VAQILGLLARAFILRYFDADADAGQDPLCFLRHG